MTKYPHTSRTVYIQRLQRFESMRQDLLQSPGPTGLVSSFFVQRSCIEQHTGRALQWILFVCRASLKLISIGVDRSSMILKTVQSCPFMGTAGGSGAPWQRLPRRLLICEPLPTQDLLGMEVRHPESLCKRTQPKPLGGAPRIPPGTSRLGFGCGRTVGLQGVGTP